MAFSIGWWREKFFEAKKGSKEEAFKRLTQKSNAYVKGTAEALDDATS